MKDLEKIREFFSIMRSVEIKLRSQGDDTMRIDGFMALVIVVFNVMNVYRFCNARHLIDSAQIIRQIWEVIDALAIAFEMADINSVKRN